MQKSCQIGRLHLDYNASKLQLVSIFKSFFDFILLIRIADQATKCEKTFPTFGVSFTHSAKILPTQFTYNCFLSSYIIYQVVIIEETLLHFVRNDEVKTHSVFKVPCRKETNIRIENPSTYNVQKSCQKRKMTLQPYSSTSLSRELLKFNRAGIQPALYSCSYLLKVLL